MSPEAIFYILECAGRVIEYLKEVEVASEERKKVFTTLVHARGLLMTVNDLAQQSEDSEWIAFDYGYRRVSLVGLQGC